jgi:hypothetical protein
MTVTLVRPERVNRVDVHHQVAVTQGSRTVYLAGQVSWDTDGNLVGCDDVAALHRDPGRAAAGTEPDHALVLVDRKARRHGN